MQCDLYLASDIFNQIYERGKMIYSSEIENIVECKNITEKK